MALGAVVRNNSVHDEAMTVILGGVVCGAIAGFVGMMILISSPGSFKIMDSLLQAGAVFSLPAMGHLLRDYDSYKYTDIIIDMFVGGCIIGGGICCCVFVIFFTIGLSLDLKKRDTDNAPVEEAQASPVATAALADVVVTVDEETGSAQK